MRLAARFRRAFVFGVAATTIASGLTLTSFSTQAAHAGNNNVQPPVDDCFSQAGYCDDAFMKAAIGPTTVISPVSETDTTATFTFTSPSAGIDTHDPVACGDAGCLFNHYDWNAYAQFNHFQVVSGCASDDDTCTVTIYRGQDDWVPLVASLNDYPTALWLMWAPAITTGQVSGVVTDGLGHGVPNLTVTITGPNTNATGETGSDGSYLWIVKPGSYVVTVSDANNDVFAPSPATVAISTTPSVVNFGLALHTLSGHVQSVTCGASCRLKGAPGIPVGVDGVTSVGTQVAVTATTGNDGSWSEQLPNGSYTETPKKGDAEFTPPELTVKTTGDLDKQDFRVCANAVKAAGEGLVAAEGSLCPYGLDWTMPTRLKWSEVNDWKSYQWGIASNSQVYPKDFEADVFLTQGGAKLTPCPTDVVWTWKITKRPDNSAGAKLANTTGCTVKLLTPTLGTFSLTAVERNKKTHHLITQFDKPEQVVVKDWLIGAVGDSNGSGEGNPPFFFDQCNRSRDSYQLGTAIDLEEADPRTSVTFVWASCSGATVEDLVSNSYVGITPGKPMPPQLEQLAERADPIQPSRAKRKYDAILTSIGVNNLAFGAVLKYCIGLTQQDYTITALRRQNGDLAPITWPSCMNVKVQRELEKGSVSFDTGSPGANLPTLDSFVRGKIGQLGGQYASYKAALRRDLPGVQPKHVIMTTYPDFSHGTDGSLCGGSPYTYDTDTFPHFTTDEWGWLSTMGTLLNQQVANSRADGFTPVLGVDQLYAQHGYCAQVPWIRTIAAAVLNHLNTDGPFHPTEVGHEKAADLNFPQLCAVLTKNNDCTSDNPND